MNSAPSISRRDFLKGLGAGGSKITASYRPWPPNRSGLDRHP